MVQNMDSNSSNSDSGGKSTNDKPDLFGPADDLSSENKGKFEFSDIENDEESHKVPSRANMDFILDIPLEITIELGRTKMIINDLLKLGQGSIIELSKPAGNTLEILANNRLIARGDVVVVNEKYGIRLTEVISPEERLKRLK